MAKQLRISASTPILADAGVLGKRILNPGVYSALPMMQKREYPGERRVEVSAEGDMPTTMVERTIRLLDRIITEAESRAPHFSEDELHHFIALRAKRTGLHLLLVARRVECRKRIVSLVRWRQGFDAPAYQ